MAMLCNVPTRPLHKARRIFSAAALLAIAGLAHADVPPVLDRMPANTSVAMAVKNIGQFSAKLKAMVTPLGVDPADLGEMDQILGMPGLNKDGSAALFLSEPAAKPADANDPTKPNNAGVDEKPVAVFVVPVSDYAGFITAIGGGTASKGVTEVKMQEKLGGETFFFKDIGGGYAAMAKSSSELNSFEGKGGNKAAAEKLVGKVGSTISNSSDGLLIANMDLLRPKLEKGLATLKEQTDMIAQMAGGGGEQLQTQMKIMQAASDAYMKDASVTIIGLGMSEAGVAMDMGTQFKEGSDAAKLFAAKGDSSAVLNRLPNQPFYFAFASDFSSPGIKQLVRNAMKLQQLNTDPATKIDDSTMGLFAKNIDTIGSMGMVMGASPGGLMGGLFTNTVSYVSSTTPADLLVAQKQMLDSLNGKTMNGVTYKTTYAPAALEIEGVKADQWSMQMQVDPNNPAAMQMQQMQAMIFGMGGGPSGYNALVDNGLVITMSQNTPLLTMAVKSAKEGKGLGEDALLKDAQKNLPDGRTFEGYIGVKALLDTAAGFMAMMGGGSSFQSPPTIAPIAIGGTTNDGAFRAKFFIPASTMKTIGDFAKSLEGAGEEEDGGDAAPEEKGKAPRF